MATIGRIGLLLESGSAPKAGEPVAAKTVKCSEIYAALEQKEEYDQAITIGFFPTQDSLCLCDTIQRC